MRTTGQTRRRKRGGVSSRGLSLIECMMAVTVLTVTVAGLVMPFSLAAKAQRLDAMQTTATTLANQQMERLVLMNKNDVLALNGTTEVGQQITSISGEAINHDSLSAFTRSIASEQITITEPGFDGEAVFVRATVTVSRDGMPDVTITRLFGDVGFFGQASDDDDDDTDADVDSGDDHDRGHGNDADGYDEDNPSNRNSNSNSNDWLDDVFDSGDDDNNGRGNDNDRGRGNDNNDRGNGNGRGNDDNNGRGNGNGNGRGR